MKKIKDFIGTHKIIISCVAILAVLVASVLVFGWIGLWYDIIIAAIVGISLTGMKKHGLLKILSIIMLLLILVSNLLPGRQDVIDRIGIADLLINYFSIVLQNFSYIVLFILAVGGFYGILNKTASYKKLLDNIVTKVKPYGKKIIFLISIIFAVIASLTGMTIPLFIFIPFVISIILLLGYDKLVAITSTFGSIMIGYMGGVFVNFINPNTYSITTYEEFVGLESKFANVFPKLLLLFASIALLIYFVGKHIKNVEEKKVKYELSDNGELLIAEVKGDYKNIKTWPLIVVLSLIFIILVIGIIPWNGLFGISVFSDFHTWLTGLTVNKIKIFPAILSDNLPALGEWFGSGNFMAGYVYSSMLLTFATVLIALINRIKVNDALDYYTEGAKKLLPSVAIVTVAYTVLVCAYNNGFLELLISNYGKFNYGISSLLAILGCILNVDTTWIIAGVFAPILNLITDESVYASVALLFQGIYGIFMLVGPTSLFLILGLTYLDVPYTTWLKYIWRFILALIILLALVVLLVTLM
mgnify:CR=1 FL=1